MMDTWNYLSVEQDYTRDSIPIEYVWERLRNERNNLLGKTDYKMIPDAPWDTEPWAAYRQALRDLPEQTIDPREAVWPEPPTD
jgi:hypothetical protein